MEMGSSYNSHAQKTQSLFQSRIITRNFAALVYVCATSDFNSINQFYIRLPYPMVASNYVEN